MASWIKSRPELETVSK